MNRKAFFASVRKSFYPKGMKQPEVDGLNKLLDVWERDYRNSTPLTQFAYCLGTAYHETAFTMQPIREHGNAAYFTRMYDIQGSRPELARRNGNVYSGDGPRFYGRGYVQLTWRSNYKRAGDKIGVDLISNPDRAMEPDIAAKIMFEGMEAGWFTGVSLDKSIDANVDDDEHADFIRARRIINGTDRAEKIADYSDRFLAALIASDAGTPRPPDIEPPKPAIPPAEPRKPAVAGTQVAPPVGGVAIGGAAKAAGFDWATAAVIGVAGAVLIAVAIHLLKRKP